MPRGLPSALLFCAALTAPAPSIAQSFGYSFEGAWDCGVGTFTFTDQTYDNGSDTLRMTEVTEDSSGFLLTFADGYQIALSEVTDTSMVWLSGASGDMFECTRLP